MSLEEGGRGSGSEPGDETMEAEAGVKHFEDGGRGHEPKTAGASRKWKRQEADSPMGPPEGIGPAHALILAQQDPCRTLDFQDCQIINLWGFTRCHTKLVVIGYSSQGELIHQATPNSLSTDTSPFPWKHS